MNARKAIHDITAAFAVGLTLAALLWLAALGTDAEALPALLLAGGALALWAGVVACRIGEPK